MNTQRIKSKTPLVVWSIFRFILIFGLCFTILYPFIIKILAAFMSPDDLLDSTVKLIPKALSSYYWEFAWERLDVLKSGFLSIRLAVISGVIQVIVSTMAGYGLARFNFKGRTFVLLI